MRKLLIVSLISVLGVFAFSFTPPTDRYFEIAKNLDIFASLFKEVNALYVDEVNPNQLIRTGIDAMLISLDPYTNYIAEDEVETYRTMNTGQYGGIGAATRVIGTRTLITMIYEGYPAQRNGLKIGDEVIKLDEIELAKISIEEANQLMRGQVGTTVKLSVKRVGVPSLINLEFKREKIKMSNVPYFGMVGTNSGYIKLTDFTPDAGKEVRNAVVSLKDQGAKNIILDLRDNPGGLLLEAVNICNIFIPKGKKVVTTKGKVQNSNATYETLNNPVDLEIPLAVLINRGSASASEIFAAAIQDYNRGIIIGSSSTYGKGTVQRSISLDNNSFFSNDTEIGNLKLTLQKFYRINGGSTQLKGVTPDIILPDNFEYLKLREKDDPDALPWDVMSKATYKPWNNGTYLKQIAALYQQKITAHPIFAAIQKNAAWLAKENDKVYSLQLSTYQAEQKKIKAVVSQLDSMVKINKPLQINSLPQDVAKYNSVDKEKSERYKQWLKSLKTDIYLSQTVDIISDIFQQGNWARN